MMRSGVEIRGVRESELEKMIDLQLQVYTGASRERLSQYVRGDSSYRLDQTRVVVVDGQIVSTLRVWDRTIRIGSCAVPMGGIGGVGTHPDHRDAGYATALMKDATLSIRNSGYLLSALFSSISQQFYRKLGWESLPLTGFRIMLSCRAGLEKTDWEIEPFEEGRDLEQVIALYDTYNARQSGSLVRSSEHWDTAPARLRQILPTVVARRGDRLGGYLNFRIRDKNAHVLEVAIDRCDATSLVALVDHLLRICAANGIEQIEGEIPHRHPLVNLLIEGSGGDLFLPGTTTMMLFALDLRGLLKQVLPDLQSRLDASGETFIPLTIAFDVSEQQRGLRLDESGTLKIVDDDAKFPCRPLSGSFFWRALFGKSSWSQIEPALAVRGVQVTPEVAQLLSILFPQQEVIFWGPEHY